MKNYGLIYRYEIKKILNRRLARILFGILLLLTFLVNMSTVFEYSVGENGAGLRIEEEYGSRTDYKAFFSGIGIRYVDESGDVVEKTVGPLQYIRIQRKFAKKWSGQVLDDSLIQDMQDFIAGYDYTDTQGRTWGWSFQNYKWVYQVIYSLGLNPDSPETCEKSIEDYMRRSWTALYNQEQLTEQEIDYWNNHEKMQFPLILSYFPAYQEIIEKSQWINIMLLFFVMSLLCDVNSADSSRRVRPLVQATGKGMKEAITARLFAGITVGAGSGGVLYGLTMLIQFAILGADGFGAPLQMIPGLVWSSLSLTAGEAMLLVCGTGILLAIAMAAITMLLSGIFRNQVASISVISIFLVLSILFEKNFLDKNRQLAQLFQYFPIQRIRLTMLYDERLVSAGGIQIEAIPFSAGIYILITAIALLVSGTISYARRRDRL